MTEYSNYNWIYIKKFTINTDDDFTPPFVKYIYISDKGDLIYLESDTNYDEFYIIFENTQQISHP